MRDTALPPAPVSRSAPEVFAASAEAVGARTVVTDLDGARQYISALSSTSIGLSNEVRALLPGPKPESEPAETPHTAVSIATGGIADSGTVVLAEMERRDRLLFMLARSHIVLLPAGRIVADIADAVHIMRRCEAEGRRYVTWVSGPSRTADIEKILTIGAHGAAELTILIFTGTEPNAD